MTEKIDIIEKFKRIPRHIGVIPDGNRRWAVDHNLEKQCGYAHGVDPGIKIYNLLLKYGVEEVTFYGFTKDNTNRPAIQTESYVRACIEAVEVLANKDANILVLGNTESKIFPEKLLKYANKRVNFGKGLININYLINYDWNWDLLNANNHLEYEGKKNMSNLIISKDISRIDLILRWGGRRRLSGFLPVQSVYSDFYIIDDFWPDYRDEHFIDALRWYQGCDVTLGG